jgi:hypothetical protein
MAPIITAAIVTVSIHESFMGIGAPRRSSEGFPALF